MLSIEELNEISKHRLRDSIMLFNNGRLDGSIYLCGYALEAMLKSKICLKLFNCKKYPSTNKEFKNLQNLKQHNLDTLLELSGAEKKIKKLFFSDWSIVSKWNSEIRYNIIGTATKKDVKQMLKSTKSIIKNL